MNERLGLTYRDIITGFEGVCIAHVEYITGCNQTLLQPVGEKSKKPDSEWFDDQRLEVVEIITRKVLDNGATPGCDKSAPKI